MKNFSLKIKLLVFTLGISLGSLLLAGYLVDRNLLDYHESTAKDLINEGFASLDAQLDTLEEGLASEAGYISKEERLLAALNLINNFQDTQNYQAIIFDEEKQRLTRRLQTSVQSGLSTGAYVYAADQKLVSFVQQEEQGYLQGFVSYKKGQASLQPLRVDSLSQQTLDQQKQRKVFKRAELHAAMTAGQKYHQYDGHLYLEQKYPLKLMQRGQEERVGFLVITRKLDLNFLLGMSRGGLEGGLLSTTGELLVGQKLVARYQEQLQEAVQNNPEANLELLQTPSGFWGIRKLDAAEDQATVAFLYPNASYQAAQGSTRQAIAMALLLAAFVIIPMSLLLVRQLVTRPLEHLSVGVEKMRQGDLLTPIELASQDELGRFADAMNIMAMQLYRREQSLNASNLELQRLSEVMAHHFQEPTRRLMVFAQRLQNKAAQDLDEDSQLSVEFIYDQASRLSFLVRDVQRYLELDKVHLPNELVNLNQLLEELLQQSDIKEQIVESGARIQVAPELPNIYFSRRRLTEMFKALLTNALVYRNPEKNLVIRVSSKRFKDCNYIYISDNGNGIEPRHRVQVFDLFTRLVSSDHNPGTGMGLALVRRLMKQAGGDITIEDGLDGGTTFVLSFPDQELNLHD
ncbi:HAMP domain-containing sensor histidine kinase [Marinospirillum sp.]|uniref:sensor histidine kinase n=1 Tax=Marinospirillum sp. TaxID=2183934 RepID=UPI00286FC42E|nr:HAMP domain-containing sensor histidine kinase [Marinospirillum sp.]MDR9467243.1 HAMP domain-containing sensor histidine kinase [Marinospirillum sp.]